MKILIVLAHPTLGSFNHAISELCINKLRQKKHDVIFHDLYKERFDPLLYSDEIPKEGQIDDRISNHCSELEESDGIIIIHPNWWGQPPAILKGWIDRVIRPGVAYEFQDGDQGEGIPIGLLKAKAALVFNTSNTSKDREDNAFKDPLETIWKNCVFDLCGVKVFERHMFRIMVTSTPSQRQEWLDEVSSTIDKYF